MVSGINSVCWSLLLAPLLYAENGNRRLVTTRTHGTEAQNMTEGSIDVMSRGSMTHVETFVLKVGLTSLIVNAYGTEMLATLNTQQFYGIHVTPAEGSRFNLIPDADVFPMYLMMGGAESLTINGVYEGDGKGELYVSFGESEKVAKFENGVSSVSQTYVPIMGRLRDCKVRSILKLYSTDNNGFLLLGCNTPTYVVHPGLNREPRTYHSFYPVYAYNETSDEVKSFIIQSRGKFEPIDMAQLPNGDLIVLFRRLPGKRRTGKGMRLEYIAADALYQALSTGSIIMPERMASWPEKIELPIGRPQSLAIRQDPITSKIFIYILATTNNSDDNDDHTTSISMYEWDPTPIGPRLPDERSFSHNGELRTMTALWIAITIAFSIRT